MGRKDSANSGINIKKIVIIAILWIAVIICGVISSKGHKSGKTVEITRPLYGDEREVSLTAESSFGEKTLDIDILSLLMSEEEIERNLEDFMPVLEEKIRNGNDSLMNIRSEIKLPETVEGFPYEMEYEITPRGIIDRKGKPVAEVDEPTDLNIEITIYYDDLEFKRDLKARFIKGEETKEDLFWQQVEKQIKDSNENERLNAKLILPTSIDGTSVGWKYNERNQMPAIIILAFTISVLLIFKNRIEAGSEERKRREQIRKDYPEFAVKYALLIGAGLPNRQTMEKIVSDYRQRSTKSPLYEEMAVALSEIKSGLSQSEALNNLAARCQVREVTQFVSLLNQNIRKGGDKLECEIKKEAMESLESKKEDVRKRAEQAGTKLLIPMTLLLIIVFVLIIYPAFGSFTF